MEILEKQAEQYTDMKCPNDCKLMDLRIKIATDYDKSMSERRRAQEILYSQCFSNAERGECLIINGSARIVDGE